jgi:hypothetical protein
MATGIVPGEPRIYNILSRDTHSLSSQHALRSQFRTERGIAQVEIPKRHPEGQARQNRQAHISIGQVF